MWTKRKLDEIAIEKRVAYMPLNSEHLPYLGLEHIEQQSLKLSGVGDSADAGSQKKRFQIGEVLYGSLRPYFRKVYRAKFGGVCSTDITVLSAKGENLNEYLFYLIASTEFIKKASNSSNGTKMPRAGWNIVKDFEFEIPDSKTQFNCAALLGTYDDLIENNQERIGALEEIAQLLYTEWFVKFKFPGHEKAKVMDSGTEHDMIPEGWEIKKFGDIIELAYGRALKEENRIEGNVMVYGSSGLVGTHNEKLVNGPGIVVGRKGNAGAVHWVDDDFYPIDTTYYVKSNLDLHFIYYLLKNHGFVMGDVAVPGLNRSQTYLNAVLLPPTSLITAFSARVSHIFNLVSSLSKKNLRLRKMRDLLIPQLVTGKRILK